MSVRRHAEKHADHITKFVDVYGQNLSITTVSSPLCEHICDVSEPSMKGGKSKVPALSVLCALLLLFCYLQSESAVARKNNGALRVFSEVAVGDD